MKHKSINDGAWDAEDKLLDLRALVRFALFHVENADPDSFKAAQSEWCTMLYLMKDKVDACFNTVGEMGIMARATDDKGRAHH
ncbi:MAG: hypothetical protein ACK4M8_05390 [Allorhizobium sp.]